MCITIDTLSGMRTLEESIRARKEKERGSIEWQPTELWEAVCQGNDRQVRKLLDGGRFDVDERSPMGDTLLFEAAKGDYFGIMRMLIECGVDKNALNNYGDSALHFAANRYSFDSVQVLIEKGADMSIANKEGNTPLHWVLHTATSDCEWDRIVSMTALLVRAGADMNAGDGVKNTPFIELARMYVQKEDPTAPDPPAPDYNLLSVMIKHGADINATGFEHRTALHTAALTVDLHLLLYLVQHGADWNVPDHNGLTLFETLVSPLPETEHFQVKDTMVQHQRRKHFTDHVHLLAFLEDIKQAMIDIPREHSFMMLKAFRTPNNPFQRMPSEILHRIQGHSSVVPTARDRCVRCTALYRLKSLGYLRSPST